MQGPVDVVERAQAFARERPAHDDLVGEVAEVERVQGLTEEHHHVVRDVDGERDRAHADLGEPAPQPRGRGGGGVDAADDPGDVAVAPRHRVDRGVVDHAHGIPMVRARRHGHGRRRVCERGAGGQGVLARDPAHGEAVATVGRHVDLDGLAVEPEDRDRVGPRHEGGERGLVVGEVVGEDDDARVVVTDAELAGRADHPCRDVAVGLAGAHLERPVGARERSARQDDRHEVPGLEVVRPADDPLRLAGPVRRADVDETPADRLAVLLRFGVLLEDPADDERAADGAAVQVLLLEADPDEVLGDLGAAERRVDVGQLTQPLHGDAHQISIPNCRLNRTSPSTMSCMSATPWRCMRERSIPSPNAKPV